MRRGAAKKKKEKAVAIGWGPCARAGRPATPLAFRPQQLAHNTAQSPGLPLCHVFGGVGALCDAAAALVPWRLSRPGRACGRGGWLPNGVARADGLGAGRVPVSRSGGGREGLRMQQAWLGSACVARRAQVGRGARAPSRPPPPPPARNGRADARVDGGSPHLHASAGRVRPGPQPWHPPPGLESLLPHPGCAANWVLAVAMSAGTAGAEKKERPRIRSRSPGPEKKK